MGLQSLQTVKFSSTAAPGVMETNGVLRHFFCSLCVTKGNVKKGLILYLVSAARAH